LEYDDEFSCEWIISGTADTAGKDAKACHGFIPQRGPRRIFQEAGYIYQVTYKCKNNNDESNVERAAVCQIKSSYKPKSRSENAKEKQEKL
jgi:hypothetical protein